MGFLLDEDAMPRPFDLVVFDIGGVLVELARFWDGAAELAGLPFPGASRDAFDARVAALPSRDRGAVDSESYYVLFAEASEGVYSAADAARIDAAELVAEQPGIGGVFDVLDTVGVETVLLSNVNDAHWARFFAVPRGDEEFPTLLRARHRFASYILGMMKPDPAVYRHIEATTGFEASRILYFDDSSRYVTGARGLGWAAEVIDPSGDTAAQMLGHLRRLGVID